MQLSYGQVFRLFADLLQINEGKETALIGRLKHFQRAGFPRGTNVGQGPKAVYGVAEVFALAFAFRLIRFRYTPKAAMTAVDANFGLVARVVSAAYENMRGDTASKGGDLTFIRIIPDGVEDLRRPTFGDGEADVMVEVNQQQVWIWMRGVEAIPDPGLVLIDHQALVAETLGAIERLQLATPLQIAKGFYILAGSPLLAGYTTGDWNH